MTARFEPKSVERDLIAAIRRAARQEQFLEVVSAEEARARFDRHIDLSPLPHETIALTEALWVTSHSCVLIVPTSAKGTRRYSAWPPA